MAKSRVFLSKKNIKATKTLWETYESVEGYLRSASVLEFHVPTNCKHLEYLDFYYAKKYMKALLFEIQTVYNSGIYQEFHTDMQAIKGYLKQMDAILVNLDLGIEWKPGSLERLLWAKQEFLFRYARCVSHLDSLGVVLGQRVYAEEGKGTLIYSDAFMVETGVTPLSFIQQILGTEEDFVFE